MKKALMLTIVAGLFLVSTAEAFVCTVLDHHENRQAVTSSIDEVTLWYHNLGDGYGQVGNFMADETKYENMRQLLIEAGIIETRLGTVPDSYSAYAKGWSQFIPPKDNPQVAFNEVKSQLSKPENSARAAAIKEKWGLDVSTVVVDELSCNDDWGTVFALEYFAFGILIDKSISSEYKDITTPEGRAAFWKNFYNRAGEAGLPEEEYLERNTEPDKNGILWTYSGSYESYDLCFDEERDVEAQAVSFTDDEIEFDALPCFGSAASFEDFYASLAPNDCVQIEYCDDFYSKPEAEDLAARLRESPLWVAGTPDAGMIFISKPRLEGDTTPVLYDSPVDIAGEGEQICNSVKTASFWYPGCDGTASCPMQPVAAVAQPVVTNPDSEATIPRDREDTAVTEDGTDNANTESAANTDSSNQGSASSQTISQNSSSIWQYLLYGLAGAGGIAAIFLLFFRH